MNFISARLTPTSTAKLAEIKATASPQTHRKAAIINDQLGRQYSFLSGCLDRTSGNVNLLTVARWFSNLDPIMQSTLGQAEPFTWLKHLHSHGATLPNGVPWHLSALIMEEYVHSQQASRDRINTIMEDRASTESSHPTTFFVPPGTSSRSSLRPSWSGDRLHDGRVSFEPTLDSIHHIPEAASRKSGDSTYSSIFSGSSMAHPVSPTRFPARDVLPPKLERRPHNESDDASSARHSLRSDADPRRDAIAQTIQKVDSEGSSNPSGMLLMSGPPTARPSLNDTEVTFTEPNSLMSASRNTSRSALRVSLPPVERLSMIIEQQRQQEVEEARADREYELKAQ